MVQYFICACVIEAENITAKKNAKKNSLFFIVLVILRSLPVGRGVVAYQLPRAKAANSPWPVKSRLNLFNLSVFRGDVTAAFPATMSFPPFSVTMVFMVCRTTTARYF